MPDFLALASDLFFRADLNAAGLPSKFLVLPYGPGSLTLHGVKTPIHFTREMAQIIVANAESRGVTVPVDFEHGSFLRGKVAGLEEMDFLRTKPAADENPAAGYVRLTAEPDGLFAIVQQWIPRAAELLKNKMYKYFSPVIRGLADGNLRISSIALSNNPALDNQVPLVAKSELDKATTKGNPPMPEFLQKLLVALGLAPDAVAMSAEGAVPEEGQSTIFGTITALKALASDNPDAAALKSENDRLKAAAETSKRQALVETGLREGKLTVAMLDQDAIKGMDALALSAYLDATPVNSRVPVLSQVNVGALPDPDAIETPETEKIRVMFGNPPKK